MKVEEEESAPRTSGGADRGKIKKKRSKSHIHIGPNARAFRTGGAFCPMCDSEKILRLTEQEREADRAVREARRSTR